MDTDTAPAASTRGDSEGRASATRDSRSRAGDPCGGTPAILDEVCLSTSNPNFNVIDAK